MEIFKKSPGSVIIFISMYTLLQFSLGGSQLHAQSGTIISDSVFIKEAQKKEMQAEQLKVLCPHYPKLETNQGGLNLSFDTIYKKWISDYPQEYAAFKNIFNY